MFHAPECHAVEVLDVNHVEKRKEDEEDCERARAIGTRSVIKGERPPEPKRREVFRHGELSSPR